MANTHAPYYYVPASSKWPVIGSIALFSFMLGLANWLHGNTAGPILTTIGVCIILYMLFGWFRDVINESMSGKYSQRVDRSFRLGMTWFIFTELMFFSGFFFALFYVRLFALPDLGSADSVTNQLLWPEFQSAWPLLQNPDPTSYPGPKQIIGAWGLPAFNTLLLLTSGATITWAHWGLLKRNQKQLILGLTLTVLLGIVFLIGQIHEYFNAYGVDYALRMDSGIYGALFFILTGFHGLHVTLGVIMLTVLLLRAARHHFTPEHHFAFEGIAWYWHFVDVVWLFLFVFVYWL